MEYVEAPNRPTNLKSASLFLAGGITGCENWQVKMVELLSKTDLTVYNPRRKDFPIHIPSAAREQITWEWKHLKEATAISFWFAKETIQPIVLFELGAWAKASKALFIGVHPEYPRRQDVEIQMALERPYTPIHSSLEELAAHVVEWDIRRPRPAFHGEM